MCTRKGSSVVMDEKRRRAVKPEEKMENEIKCIRKRLEDRSTESFRRKLSLLYTATTAHSLCEPGIMEGNLRRR